MSAQIPKKPFENIAICLSGGGYRAAAFHLGTLFYLNRIQINRYTLLSQVKAISTVSGGTITGVMYELMKAQGYAFNDIYKHIYDTIRKNDLIELSIEKLKNEDKWNNKSKKRNLINAFAEVYDELFTKGATFNDIGFNDEMFVSFNATEFNNGLGFRFQTNGRPGNRKVNFSIKSLKEIKLADIIAASSCFPGGFEPMSFPYDFQYEGSNELNQLAKTKSFKKPVGLMDGGIIDNQGIDSLLLREDRLKKSFQGYDKRFGLFIISDVSSPNIKDFSFHERKDSKFDDWNLQGFLGQIKSFQNKIKKAWRVILAICFTLLIAGLVLGYLLPTQLFVLSIFFFFAGGAAATIILAFWGSSRYKKLIRQGNDVQDKAANIFKSKVPEYYQKKLQSLPFDDFTFKQLEEPITDRAISLYALISQVFMKRIRQLNYNKIYENNDFKYRRISNLITELTSTDFNERTCKYQKKSACPPDLIGSYEALISKPLRSVLNRSAKFGTTLWFTEQGEKLDEQLQSLLVAGQATTCFNLIIYIIELKSDADKNGYHDLDHSTKMDIEAIYNSCMSDWFALNANPFHFFEKQLG